MFSIEFNTEIVFSVWDGLPRKQGVPYNNKHIKEWRNYSMKASKSDGLFWYLWGCFGLRTMYLFPFYRRIWQPWASARPW